MNVSESLRYDANLFSLPDGIDPPVNGRRSATTRQSGVDLRIDKPYAQQQFDLYATLAKIHYNPYDNLDTTSHAYGVHWAWVLTPELKGNISIDESRSPNSFTDTGFQTTANPRTQQNKTFDIDFRPGAALHPRLAFLQSEDKSAQTTIERENASTNSVQGAIVYDFASANSADLYFRRGRGRYFDQDLDPTLADNSLFNEREVGLEAHYQADGASAFDGRVGFITRRHRDFAQRDFSGLVAQLDYTFVATGKTSVRFTAYRTLSASETTFSSYSRDEGLTIRPEWAATGKITVRSSISFSNRDFRGGVIPDTGHLKFHTRDESLDVNWDAERFLQLTAQLFHASRGSSNPLYPFTNRGGMVTARLRF